MSVGPAAMRQFLPAHQTITATNKSETAIESLLLSVIAALSRDSFFDEMVSGL
jgi:hypothetical protein